jgi:hypothetical protein
MQVTGLQKNGGTMGPQVAFLAKGTSGTLHVEITTGTPFNAVTGNTASLGPLITVGTVTATAGATTSTVHIPYTVDPAAIPGVRNLSFSIASGERLFVPAYVEVVDTTSALTVSASAGNPPPGAAALGLPNVPLLGFTLTANAVEDIRVRRLQFNVSGSGSQMPKVKLWFDNGTLGVKDGADVQIFSGAAYATPGVIDEVIPANASGTVVFDNLAVTIPAGQSINFLFTGDMPAAGNSSYTVDLNGSASNITATGMFWANSIAATGTAAGNQHDAGTLALANPKQLKTTGLTAIPLGGTTNETQVTIQGLVTSSIAGTVGLDVEVQPLGTDFTGFPNGQATGATSPATINVNVTPLVNFTSYHWQARPTHSTQAPGNWVSFDGTNAENEIDFSCDNSTTNVPTGLQQFEKDGTTIVPVGGFVKGRVVFKATNGTNSGAQLVRLEIEVQPVGTAFTGTPNVLSGYVASGAAAAASFAGKTDTYHWQARTANAFGTASAWVNFDPAATHFDFKKTSGGGSGGGCLGTVAGGGAGLGWALLGLGLVVVFARGRSM